MSGDGAQVRIELSQPRWSWRRTYAHARAARGSAIEAFDEDA
jgi:hypothetical protein